MTSNSLLRVVERIGGDQVSYAVDEDHVNCMDICQLQEVNYIGYDFTWSNRQGSTIFYTIVYRILINKASMMIYPGVFYEVLSEAIPYHCPLSIQLHNTQRRRRHQFMFFSICGLQPLILEMWCNRFGVQKSLARVCFK